MLVGPGVSAPGPCQTPVREVTDVTQTTCSVDACESVARSKKSGLCNRHWFRMKRYGTTERLQCPCGKTAVNATGPPRCDGCRAYGVVRLARRRDLHRYGITPDDYDCMLVEQNDRCAICRSDDPGHGRRNFSVDHDHRTGVVRALLCQRCNLMIGYADDRPETLRAAADYLDRF